MGTFSKWKTSKVTLSNGENGGERREKLSKKIKQSSVSLCEEVGLE